MGGYVIAGGQPGFNRLQVLAQLRLPDTRALFDRVGVETGWDCVDLGSGSGDIALELGRQVGREGTVTGLDMDAVKVQQARSVATELGMFNVSFAIADLNEWSAVAEFDLAYCGLVLQHLAAPAELLRRMWAAVRPGGVLVVEDADFDGLFCHPVNAGFEFYADNYRAVLRRRGGDPAIGRKLCAMFQLAGIPDPQLKLVQRADRGGIGKTMAHSTLVASADAILAEGLASAEDLDRAVQDLAAFTADPRTVIGDPRIFQVWARRPA